MRKNNIFIKNKIKNMGVLQLVILAFLPFISIMLIIIGIIFQKISSQQIEYNTMISMNATLSQSARFLDNQLQGIFEGFKSIESSSDMLSLALKMTQDETQNAGGQYYINIRKDIDALFASYGNSLNSIMINFNDGLFEIYHHEAIPIKIDFNYHEWFRKNRTIYNWEFFHEDPIFLVTNSKDEQKNNTVASIFRLYGFPNQNGIGGIVLNINKSLFEEVLSIPNLGKNGYVALICDDRMSVYQNVDSKFYLPKESLIDLQNIKEINEGVTYSSIGGDSVVVFTKHLNINNWLLAAVIPEAELYEKVNNLESSLRFIIVILIIFSSIICVVLSRAIVKPIQSLTKSVEVEDIDKIENIQQEGPREVTILSRVLNELLARVQQLINRVQIEQEEKKKTELSLMQAQINPHFMYNTLYSVQQLCEFNECKEAGIMVLALANFFRIGLSKGNDMISIEEEINHVKNYLIIQHMKYGEKFEYEFSIESELLSYPILKLTLQPLIENAIYHGIQMKRGRSNIYISGVMDSGNIVLSVEDTGIGMTEERYEEVIKCLQGKPGYENISFGIKNVYSRLGLFYKDQATMQISSQLNKGTKIMIMIPAKHDKGEEQDV